MFTALDLYAPVVAGCATLSGLCRRPPAVRRPPWRFLLGAEGWPYLLTPLIPIAVVLELAHASSTAIFITSALGVVPPAALMGRATEELAARSGPGIGGLLNVTFGNFPELVIAFFALLEGLQEVVKASIIGSIIGNILLVLGAAMLVGGWGKNEQRSTSSRGAQSAMLLLAVTALVMPAVFQLVDGGSLPAPVAEDVNFSSTLEHLSLAVAIVLIVSYLAGLFFSLRTHRDIFNPETSERRRRLEHAQERDRAGDRRSRRRAS